MTTSLPEPWLRGPVPGVPALLQPAAHALQMALEDTEAAVADLRDDEVWASPGGAASVGFHLGHLAGSTDRLMTYARGEALTPAQRESLLAESRVDAARPATAALIDAWRARVALALAQLAATDAATLTDAREVGRARLPSTVLGLLFHAAEHASRHAGQLVTTAKVVRSARRS